MALAHLIGEGRRDRPSSSLSAHSSSSPSASVASPQVYSRSAMLKLWRKDAGPGKPMTLTHDPTPASHPHAPVAAAAATSAPAPLPHTDRRERERSAGMIDRGAMPRSRIGSAPGQGVLGVLSGLVPGTSAAPSSPTALNGIKSRSTALTGASDSLSNGHAAASSASYGACSAQCTSQIMRRRWSRRRRSAPPALGCARAATSIRASAPACLSRVALSRLC